MKNTKTIKINLRHFLIAALTSFATIFHSMLSNLLVPSVTFLSPNLARANDLSTVMSILYTANNNSLAASARSIQESELRSQLRPGETESDAVLRFLSHYGNLPMTAQQFVDQLTAADNPDAQKKMAMKIQRFASAKLLFQRKSAAQIEVRINNQPVIYELVSLQQNIFKVNGTMVQSGERDSLEELTTKIRKANPKLGSMKLPGNVESARNDFSWMKILGPLEFLARMNLPNAEAADGDQVGDVMGGLTGVINSMMPIITAMIQQEMKMAAACQQLQQEANNCTWATSAATGGNGITNGDPKAAYEAAIKLATNPPMNNCPQTVGVLAHCATVARSEIQFNGCAMCYRPPNHTKVAFQCPVDATCPVGTGAVPLNAVAQINDATRAAQIRAAQKSGFAGMQVRLASADAPQRPGRMGPPAGVR